MKIQVNTPFRLNVAINWSLSGATHVKVFSTPGIYEVTAEDANHWYTQTLRTSLTTPRLRPRNTRSLLNSGAGAGCAGTRGPQLDHDRSLRGLKSESEYVSGLRHAFRVVPPRLEFPWRISFTIFVRRNTFCLTSLHNICNYAFVMRGP